MKINGYKPLEDWYVLGAICLMMFFIGFIASRVFDPMPRNANEIMVEVSRCHFETGERCSIMVMPDSSKQDVYLLYSRHVK